MVVLLPRLSEKESACQCRRHKRHGFDSWVRKILWSRKWQPTPMFLLGESHGQRSLVGYSLWSCNELDMTEPACKLLLIVLVSLGHSFSLNQSWKWQPTLVLLPGEVHGQRSLEGYSPWDCRVGHD